MAIFPFRELPTGAVLPAKPRWSKASCWVSFFLRRRSLFAARETVIQFFSISISRPVSRAAYADRTTLISAVPILHSPILLPRAKGQLCWCGCPLDASACVPGRASLSRLGGNRLVVGVAPALACHSPDCPTHSRTLPLHGHLPLEDRSTKLRDAALGDSRLQVPQSSDGCVPGCDSSAQLHQPAFA
jgi:hypothetical protein